MASGSVYTIYRVAETGELLPNGDKTTLTVLEVFDGL